MLERSGKKSFFMQRSFLKEIRLDFISVVFLIHFFFGFYIYIFYFLFRHQFIQSYKYGHFLFFFFPSFCKRENNDQAVKMREQNNNEKHKLKKLRLVNCKYGSHDSCFSRNLEKKKKKHTRK